MTLANAIYNLLKGAQYRGNVDDSTFEQYEAIEWCDERPKPSWADCVAMMESDYTPTYYNPSKIIRALDAMGQADALEAALLAAPARRRLLWQKEIRFNGNDPDFTGLVDYFQIRLGLSDEQKANFLKQCEED